MQTLTVREAEGKLQALVEQAQSTHEPVLLMNDIATPVALLTPVDGAKARFNEIFMRRLEILESVMQMWQQHCTDPNVSQDAAQLFQNQLRQIVASSQVDKPTLNALAMLLRLAVYQMKIPAPENQVRALGTGVEMLRNPGLSWELIERVDQELLDVGIDAHANIGDAELLKTYVDAS